MAPWHCSPAQSAARRGRPTPRRPARGVGPAGAPSTSLPIYAAVHRCPTWSRVRAATRGRARRHRGARGVVRAVGGCTCQRRAGEQCASTGARRLLPGVQSPSHPVRRLLHRLRWRWHHPRPGSQATLWPASWPGCSVVPESRDGRFLRPLHLPGAWLPLRRQHLPRRPWAATRTPGSSLPRAARGAPRGSPAARSPAARCPRHPDRSPSWRVPDPPRPSPLRKPSSPAPTFPANRLPGPRCHLRRSGDVGARDLPVSRPVGALGGPDRP